ncbi:BON domain-containing protein [Janthinobacterium agaricidamnosum]|uniref:Putative phospholipid-binding domain protein n=1 Tax=Janthinobacterium agaricidamnosum NBRC 102515 = DSM 9628 TaxID=1349767 RepID=W0V346_9BURK|nr:BON domain-containing protein [Janthinobacterium agaricidamnosum]CDG81778.1 putative phospholipid-binding domain protein [Janthinobacterium agaricidamnosum NBRC 102515 = DSM 9628]
MNKVISLVLAASASALLVASPAIAQQANQSTQASGASYKNLTDKASSDYKAAKTACDANSGNARKVCVEEAKVARAKAESDAVAQYRNTPRELSKARKSVADAEYDLAKAKCGERSGSDKTVCTNQAKAARDTALAAADSGTPDGGAAATGQAQNQNNANPTAGSSTARTAVADTVITTKIKADLVKAPDLKALDVHVETVNGVVMLSGFVPSQTEANKAVALARSVEGVTDVKSALKVK